MSDDRARSPRPAVEAPSDDVVAAPGVTALPGEHRGGFQREFTQPTPLAVPIEVERETEAPRVEWAPAPEVLPRSGAWALGLSIVALVLSFFVGWAVPLGIAAVVTAVIALRRPWESRTIALWALALGVLSVLYSAGWLVWAAYRADLIG
ncbi:hypothetical protein [Microbacterium sp. cf332]|uniref:hypothetical protein n=1 Tax=Microbacterium sp. cf332 TaxID=1761804 RepID=UPI00088196BC|nr:hypothetical protein [Microbacterium sp. cf332]SDQ97871.1 hypothetical protein SAMN04487847_3099 [Microbacterium sp. cf332]